MINELNLQILLTLIITVIAIIIVYVLEIKKNVEIVFGGINDHSSGLNLITYKLNKLIKEMYETQKRLENMTEMTGDNKV